ncbi:MAG: hypothetical protein J6Z36_01680 [Clostridia bacterium]|nr:hypothetical protein [Clostridia bacterium]
MQGIFKSINKADAMRMQREERKLQESLRRNITARAALNELCNVPSLYGRHASEKKTKQAALA